MRVWIFLANNFNHVCVVRMLEAGDSADTLAVFAPETPDVPRPSTSKKSQTQVSSHYLLPKPACECWFHRVN